MRVNIFSIPVDQVASLRSKLSDAKMVVIQDVDQDGWHGEFYFSENPAPGSIPWVKTFAPYFQGRQTPYNRTYYAVFLFVKDDIAYALSFGKAHFYVRPYCDYDFGIELAKRIADEGEIRQTASKMFQGKRRKDIRSFAHHTRLSVGSGESVDFLQSPIIATKTATYGSSGKFGASALLAPQIKPAEIGGFLTTLTAEIGGAPRFALPRTTLITEPDEVARFDEQLLDELESDPGTTDFATNTFDLYGVDFVFSSAGTFVLKCGRYKERELEQLTMKDVKEYIRDKKIPRQKLLKLKVIHKREGESTYTEPIKQAIDFISDEDRVVLVNGRWMHFNQDYLDFLDESVRGIEMEAVEPEFEEIVMKEGEFNASQALLDAGYSVADKDFSIFKTRASTPIEAWDLKRGSTVYAVKFGTAQKLGYVCDQALGVLELLRNKAEVKAIPEFDRYCLWLGYRGQKAPANIADTGSIILKQKIDAWSRAASDLGIVPVIKISRKVNPEAETEAG